MMSPTDQKLDELRGACDRLREKGADDLLRLELQRQLAALAPSRRPPSAVVVLQQTLDEHRAAHPMPPATVVFALVKLLHGVISREWSGPAAVEEARKCGGALIRSVRRDHDKLAATE